MTSRCTSSYDAWGRPRRPRQTLVTDTENALKQAHMAASLRRHDMALQVQPQDKTVMANGLKLHYLDWGALENPPMVLLHGLRGTPTRGTTSQPLCVKTTTSWPWTSAAAAIASGPRMASIRRQRMSQTSSISPPLCTLTPLSWLGTRWVVVTALPSALAIPRRCKSSSSSISARRQTRRRRTYSPGD